MTSLTDQPVAPYPGLASFRDQDEDRELFFGRESAKQYLLQTTLSGRLTVLYGQSGIGKTSIINAGLLESLRERDYFPSVLRLSERFTDQTKFIIAQIEAKADTSGVEVATTGMAKDRYESLWLYLLETEFSKNGRMLRPFLIFDQFEDFFTLLQSEKSTWRLAFLEQIADLVRGQIPPKRSIEIAAAIDSMDDGDPERKRLIKILYEDYVPYVGILISIREDFLPNLDNLRQHLPDVLRNSFRLGPLTVGQAEEAITKPGENTEILHGDTFSFDSGALSELLQFLRTERKAHQVVEGSTVEPVQLQIICRELNHRRQRRRSRQISRRDTGGRRGLERIMSAYYKNVLRQFPVIRLGWNTQHFRPSQSNALIFNLPRVAIGKLCTKGLITRGMYRNSIIVDDCRVRFGVSSRDLVKLENERLLRVEPRLGSHFYELIHDAIVEPVRTYHRRQVFVARWSFAALLLLLPFGLYTIPKAVDYYFEYTYLSQMDNANASPAYRSAAFRYLIERDFRNFSNSTLSEFQLDGIYLLRTDLSRSILINSTLSHATLVSVDFVGADLSDVSLDYTVVGDSDFSSANLQDSDLTGAEIRNSVFRNAVLVDVNFERAELYDVDMHGADLGGSNVYDTRFENVNLTGAKLSEFEWWLVLVSPVRETVTALEEKWPHSRFSETDKYARRIQLLKEKVEREEDVDLRATLLNSLAWYRAVRGAELSQALDEIDEAIGIRDDGHSLNTRGYIKLQLGKFDDALDDLEMAVEKVPILGEHHYHLALALQRVNDHVKAKKYFGEAKEMRYSPTYELLLTPPLDPENYGWGASE